MPDPLPIELATMQLEPLPFDEAIEFWQGKVIMPPGEFYALIAEARARAFSVAGVARADMLEDIYGAVNKSLAEGLTYQQFKKEIPDIIKEMGWTGKKTWRLDNIFRTNVQGAYNAGRYKQQTDPDVASRRPYWMYDAVNDSRTRPAHRALDGKVFPNNHPFWDTWYPPNGFRCRCKVRTLSKDELGEFGLQVESEDPTGKLFEPVDPRTGNKMPARPLMPDPGWSHNPAKAGWQPDLGKYHPELKKKLTPPQIKTRADIERAVRDKLTPLFKQGFSGIKYTRATRYGMQTSYWKGEIEITTHTWTHKNFCPSKDLLDGLKALSEGATPTLNQEIALEYLWHEVGHNMQNSIPLGQTVAKNRLMETINQWVSRWTYPEMVARMGYDPKLLTHHKEVINGAYGYSENVRNFRDVLSALKIAEEEVVEAIRMIHREIPWYEYRGPLVELLAEKSGVARTKVDRLIGSIWRSRAGFEQGLQKLLRELLD